MRKREAGIGCDAGKTDDSITFGLVLIITLTSLFETDKK